MLKETSQPLRMLYCYASEDRHWPEKIDEHLTQLKQQYHIHSRFDGELLPQPGRVEKFLDQLQEADLALLLLSPYFQKVRDLWEVIGHESWAARWLGGCRVVALLLEPIEQKNLPMTTREVLPTKGVPISQWADQEQVFHELEQELRQVIEKQWVDRGNFLRDNAGGNERTLAAYDEALRLNPFLTDAWYGKAHTFLAMKQYEKAVQASDEALHLDPTHSWVWYVKGQALAGLHRYQEALHAQEEALRYNTAFYWAWEAKGAILFVLKRYQEALQAYNAALRSQPASGSIWRGKSEVLKALGQKREARDAKKNACKYYR